MERKMISVALVIVMLFSMAIPVLAASPGDFTDIPDNWSKTAIVAAISNGLLAGSDNKIMPDTDLKRSEMAAIVNRAFGATQKGDTSKFTDIPAGKWYVDDMAKAVQMGTFKGNGGKMTPENSITRQEAFAVLARAFKLTTTDCTSLDQFSDKAQLSDWAKPDLAALVAAGYVNGSGDRLNPADNISRAEFAQVMYNILKTYIKTAGTYTTVADGNVMINVPDVTLKGVTVKGDLIIGDGVGTGNVTLDAVKIEGRTVVRGGGKNSIHVINGSTITGTVVIDNVNNEVRIVTDQGTTVQKIEAGSQVVLEGSFGEVKVVGDANGRASIEVKGNIQTLTVEAKADVILTSGIVTKVDVAQTASGTTINTAQSAKVETVTANAQTNITGNGTVTNVEARANDVKVDTAGTKVTAEQGVTGVTAGGNTVAGGSTTTTPPATPATGGSSGGGGSTTNPLSGGYTGDYTAASAGTYGPASGTATVSGSVDINTAGVTLRNLIITGDLTFGAGIGNGDAQINNVTVQGRTIVNGGGSNSIHIQGSSILGDVVVNDHTGITDNKIRIVNEGTSQIASIDVKTLATIEDNSSGSNSNIGYVKASDAGLTTISGSKANGLIQNIIYNAQSFIDAAYKDKTNHILKDIYASIEMLNDNTTGIHSLKQYLYPVENNDDTNNVPSDLQATYTQVQNAYLQLWTDWYTTFPLLGIVSNLRNMNQPWITRSGQYAPSITEQQYMFSVCEDTYSSSGSTDTNSYTEDSLFGLPITAANIGNYLNGLQKQLMVQSVSVTDSSGVSKSPSAGLVSGDKVTIVFKFNNDTDWNTVVANINVANSVYFNAAAGTDAAQTINIAGTDFSNVTLKTIVLTVIKDVPAGTTIAIPKNTFDLGAVNTMIAGPVNDVKAPAVDVQIPLDYTNQNGGGNSPPAGNVSDINTPGTYNNNYTITASGTYGPSSGTATINGTLTIDPGPTGTVTLRNIVATNVTVLSGAVNSIHLNGITVTGALTVNSGGQADSVHVITEGTTTIAQTNVDSKAILESTAGSFGDISVQPAAASQTVELRGNIGGTVTIAQGADGATLAVAEGATVQTVEARAQATVQADPGAVVNTLQVTQPVPVSLKGDGAIQSLNSNAAGATIAVDQNATLEVNALNLSGSTPVTALNFTKAGKSETTVSFLFVAPTGAANVKIQQASGSDLSSWTDSTTTVPLVQNSTNATVTGLASNTAYAFKLVVTGGAYAGSSEIAFVKTCSNITDFQKANRTPTSVDFTFSAPIGATAVKIVQSTDGGNTWSRSTTTAPLNQNSTSATVTGLTPNTSYKFKLAVAGGPNA